MDRRSSIRFFSIGANLLSVSLLCFLSTDARAITPVSADGDFGTIPDMYEPAMGRDPSQADYMVTAGKDHTCAIDDTGVVCWGLDSSGQSSPPNETILNPLSVVNGDYSSCALHQSTGSTMVTCWGSPNHGILDVPPLSNPTKITLGLRHACALDDSGVVCWGTNDEGQGSPPALQNPTDISSGWVHSCAIDDTGVTCWGRSTEGQTSVPALVNPRELDVGGVHTCVIDDSGVVCWGSDNSGESTDIPVLSNPIAVTAGYNHTCALDDPGGDGVDLNLHCWGYYESLLELSGLEEPRQISAGYFYTCALAVVTTSFGPAGEPRDKNTEIICAGNDPIGKTIVPTSLVFDPDGDGYAGSANDEFPYDSSEWSDLDDDGVGDNADAFPTDPSETVDTDGDGTGDNADPDDDGDGVLDVNDDYPLGRFADAQRDYWAFSFIEALARAGITAGCGNDNYCPSAPVTRAQMAVFLERGMNGSGYSPPAASGNVFLDVSAQDFAASFIEQLANDGITAGCGNNNYCPDTEVTRDQMAVFLLRAKYGSSYSPPPATGIFNDVDFSHWAVHWIEQLAAEGITAGCGGGNYCPDAAVTRDQMAVFLVRTFGL